MMMPNRYELEGTDGYRYGFQGEEVDDEIKGEGNSVNYRFRMHDPRVGRFFAVDPLFKDYPHYTPYSFSGNKVIHAIELEGLEEHELNSGETVYGPFSSGYVDEYNLSYNEGMYSSFEEFTSSNHPAPPSIDFTAGGFPTINNVEATFSISGQGVPNAIQFITMPAAKEKMIKDHPDYFDENGFGPFGIIYNKDGKNLQTKLDGAKGSWANYATYNNYSTGPYYYFKQRQESSGFLEEVIGEYINWDFSSNSGTLNMIDNPTMYDKEAVYFTAYIVLTDYMGTGKDRVLGYFDWGFERDEFRTASSIQDGMNFVPATNLSDHDWKVINANPNYKAYQIFGNK